MKSVAFVMGGLGGQFVWIAVFFCVALAGTALSDRSLILLLTVMLAVEGVAATVCAGLVARGNGRIAALAASAFIFLVMVVNVNAWLTELAKGR